YNVKFQSPPTCTDYGVLGRHQAIEALQGYASYSTGVNTGWKYGMAGATSPAPSSPPAAPGNAVLSAGGAAPHAAPEPATAPVQNDPGPPVATDSTVRLVSAVIPSSAQPQGHYRAVVTQAATAGSVHIPVNTLAAITAV